MTSPSEEITRLLAQHFVSHQEAVTSALSVVAESAVAAGQAFVDCIRGGGKVIAFGNGGSATQASHLIGELLGRYKDNRRPYPAVTLASDPGAVTCIANDFGYEAVFERQIEALAQPGDLALGITTSGKSGNVLRALAAARAKRAVTVALTGAAGLVDGSADHVVAVPTTTTAHIQEIHLMLIHVWCAGIDEMLGTGS